MVNLYNFRMLDGEVVATIRASLRSVQGRIPGFGVLGLCKSAHAQCIKYPHYGVV